MKADKKVVVAFAFGEPATIEVNRRIADWAIDASRGGLDPIVTQRDICDVLERCSGGLYLVGNDHKGPPPTLRIARKAAEVAKEVGATRMLICCAEPHAVRCFRDVEAALDEVGSKAVVKIAFYDGDYVREDWYTADSTQPRVRSAWSWWSREIVLRLLPFRLYGWVAS